MHQPLMLKLMKTDQEMAPGQTIGSSEILEYIVSFCMCENKDADQACGNRAADQGLCIHYIDSTIPLLQNFKPLAIFCGCTMYSRVCV